MDSDMLLIDDDRDNDVNIITMQEETNMKDSMILETSVENTYTEVDGRPEKRTRYMDAEEIWNEVGRRGKILACSPNNNNNTRVPAEMVEVSMTCRNEKLPKQIGLARMLKCENILDIIRIKYINAYKVLIQFSNEVSANKLIHCKHFIDKEYKCQKTYEVGVSYGIIKDIERELSEEDILRELNSSIPILSVKRLQRRNFDTGNFENSECVRLCFKGPTLPLHVYTYGMRVRVEPYIFPVTQCSRCWKYGHTHKTCSHRENICPKCGKSHPNCDTTCFKCVNCGGKHMALSKVCPVYLKERKIRELMAEFNCTYKRAITLYVPPSPQPESTPVKTSVTTDTISNSLPIQLDHSYARKTASQTHNEQNSTLKSDVPVQGSAKKKSNKPDESNLFEKELSKVSNDSIDSADQEKQNTQNTAQEKKTQTLDYQQLIEKVKDIIFMQNISLVEKMKSCGWMIYNWITHLIVSWFSEWPVFQSIIQNGLSNLSHC